MFVVGMGGRPALPDHALSPEGRDFCARCLTHDPELRPRAADLAHHHFLLVRTHTHSLTRSVTHSLTRSLSHPELWPLFALNRFNNFGTMSECALVGDIFRVTVCRAERIVRVTRLWDLQVKADEDCKCEPAFLIA